MRLEFRQRSLLLPLKTVYNAVNGWGAIKFTHDDRVVLISAACEELIWANYYASPLSGSLEAPYVEGRFAQVMKGIIVRNKENPANYAGQIAILKAKIWSEFESLLWSNGIMTAALRIDVPWEPGHPPRVFDHGYKLNIVMSRGKRNVNLGRWLQITWLRPTIEWQEMGVSSYIERLLDATKKRSPDLRARAVALPLHELLNPKMTWAMALKLLDGVK